MIEREIIERGEQARALLGSPAFAAALDEIERDQVEAIVNSKLSDQQLREDAYCLVQGIRRLKAKLKSWAGAGGYEAKRGQAKNGTTT